jgi:N-acetyl-gamma-glutamyl-phosphate reductase
VVGVQNGTGTDQHRIAVLGASGYTGEEVVRLLALHPYFKVAALTGETQAGKVILAVFAFAWQWR